MSRFIHEATYHDQTSILWSKGIFDWDLDVIKGDIRRTSSRTVACLDGSCFYSFSSFDENDCKATVCAASNRKVVCEGAVCDPFLGTVDNPVLYRHAIRLTVCREDEPLTSILSLLCCGLQSSDIATSKCLADSQTDELFAAEDLGDNFLL